MGKSLLTWQPEHTEKVVRKILDDPFIKAIIKEPPGQNKNNIELTEQEEYEIKFKLWLNDQLERYPKALNAVEAYMKAKGKILPIEPWDFMKWFVKYAKKTGDILSVKIQPHHFELYHKELLKAMNEPVTWEDLFNELLNAGYIQSTLEVFNHVMVHKHLPQGSEKIHWLTFKRDTHDFRNIFKFSMPELNRCFRSKDGRPFTMGSEAEYNPNRNEKLSKIIEKYKTLLGE